MARAAQNINELPKKLLAAKADAGVANKRRLVTKAQSPSPIRKNTHVNGAKSTDQMEGIKHFRNYNQRSDSQAIQRSSFARESKQAT